MRALLLALTAALVLPASAQADLPLEVDGVRAVQDGSRLRIVFGPDAKEDYRKIAGRRVRVDCRTVPETDGPVLNRDDESSGTTTLLVAPKKRKPLRAGRGRYDVCDIEARRTIKRKRSTEVRIVLDLSVPVTQRGAVYLDELEAAGMLDALLEYVHRGAGQSYRTAEEAIDRSEMDAVVLPSPDATPPAGQLGLYSDASQHAAAVTVTASGRRVFLEVDGDAVSTNLTGVFPG